MNRDQFAAVQALFEQACDLEPEARARFLDEVEVVDPVVLGELRALLGIDERIRTPSPLPASIDGFRIVRVCGHGGMGTVYEAEQDSPRRRVAIKTLRVGASAARLDERFRREIEVLGRLQHPGIAQIFGAGEADFGGGMQPYFVMEYVDGAPLTTYVGDHGLDRRQRLELFVRICDAVHHAHLNGVVHRDLKPENVLVVTAGGGSPKVLDFGIARLIDAEGGLTTEGSVVQLMGTLAYMSPEQASGDSAAVDARADVYSLGVLLFELLCGGLPIDVRGRRLHEALTALANDECERLGRFDHTLRGDLETITQRALEKRLERRYATVADLAADVRRHLRNEPILARPTSAVYQLLRFTRRHRAIVWSALSVFLALVAGAVAALTFAVRANRAAAQSAATARAAQRDAYHANLFAAAAVLDSDPFAAERYLVAAPVALRGWEWRHLSATLDGRGLVCEPLPDAVTAFADLCPCRDGARLVARTDDGRVAIWRVADGALERVLPVADATALALARSGDVLVGRADGTVERHGIDGGGVTVLGRLPVAVRHVASSPSGRCIGMLGEGLRSELWLWREGDGVAAHRLTNTAYSQYALTWVDLDGDDVAVVVAGEYLVTWSLERGATRSARHFVDQPSALAALAGGKVAVGTRQRSLLLVDAASLELEARLTGHTRAIDRVAACDDGRALVTCSSDATARLWDIADRTTRMVRRARAGQAGFVAGTDHLVLSDLGELRVPGPESAGRATLAGHTGYVYWLAWSPDSRRLASAPMLGAELIVWDIGNSAPMRTFERSVEVRLAFAVDGGGLWADEVGVAIAAGVAAPADGMVQRPGLRMSTTDAVSNDGRLSSVGHGRDGGPLAVFQRGEGQLWRLDGTWWGAAFSPDSRLLAVCGRGGRIELRDARTGALQRALRGHGGDTVYCVDFHPDGERLASGGNDGAIELWDTGDWRSVHALHGHTSYVKVLAFSPDGARLASGSGDHSVRIWSVGGR